MGRLKGVICDTRIGSSSRGQHKKALNSLISTMLDKEFKVMISKIYIGPEKRMEELK